jgi:tetratricopeptide (TPR) repeat protein
MTDHSTAVTPVPATPETPAAPPLKPMVTAPLQHDADEQPYIVTSLATGIRAKGLADLMKSAESQMRLGHFNAALDSYDSAEQVAPNNPFIAMGRGFAEMGASYYGKAELDLRRAIASEPALLAGKYDIKGFLGEDRLKFVVNDLTDIYQSEKDSVRPALLLGFISHNQGDDTAAAKYLNAADQRAGGRDPIVTVMREDWGFVTPK